MSFFQTIYTSTPFGYDQPTLAGILLTARRCNERDGITGALICRGDIYLQWLEGPEVTVRALLARIAKDDRHSDMAMRMTWQAEDRMFPGWSMRHDPARSWLWPADQVAKGAAEGARPAEYRRIFAALAA